MANYKVYTKLENLTQDINGLQAKVETIGQTISEDKALEAKIAKDIKRIDGNIRKTNKSNRKKTRIRNLKIFFTRSLLVLPYILVSTFLLSLVYVGTRDLPFSRQYREKGIRHTYTIDTNGEYSDDISYISPRDFSRGTLTYKSSWEKYENTYRRVIKTYTLENLRLEELLEYVNDQNIQDKLFFMDSANTKYDYNESPSEEELNEGSYVQIVYNYSDKDDIEIELETTEEAIFITSFEMLCIIFMGWYCVHMLGIVEYTKEKVRDIKEKYKGLDISALEKLFKEQKIKVRLIPRRKNVKVLTIGKTKITIER